jgi:O-methyltransferase involved in polyketide biosynthesis
VPERERIKMIEINETTLTGVQETLLLPLWGRAKETKKKKPLLIDEKAVAIVDSISYDLSGFSKKLNKAAHIGFIARSIYFDNQIRNFIKIHPDATLVNIGCGLDTTFNRIDNGEIQWIDLDFPEVIDIRKIFISESDRQIFIAKSVFDTSWYDSIKNKKEIMFMIAGVLEYFSDQEIGRLFNDFANYCPGVEIIFEYCSEMGVRSNNKYLLKRADLIDSARLKWSLNNISDITKINNRISVMNNMAMFIEHKKNYPFLKRLVLSYFDFWKISSLAHIKIT